MLALFALEVRVGVGKQVDTVIARDDAQLASGITWQPRVPGWIYVSGAYALANLELRRNLGIMTRRNAAAKLLRCNRGGQDWGRFRRAWIWRAGFDFLRRHQAVFHRQLLIDLQPPLVIRHAKVVGRRKQLDLMTPRIQ